MKTEAEVSAVFGGTNILGYKVAASQNFDVDQPGVGAFRGQFDGPAESARILQSKLVDTISIAVNPKFQWNAML